MKKIIVTGATGGLGQAISNYLSQNYQLILSSRCEDRLHTLKFNLGKAANSQIQCQKIDYSDRESAKEYGAWLESNLQKVDGIVLMTPRPILKNTLFPTPDEWQDFFQSNFIGPLDLLKTVIPHFNQNGKIVIISGITSTQLMPNCSTMGVLRSMWLSQAKSLSYELGPKGINVNTISPGGVMTEGNITRMPQKANNNGLSFEEQYAESVSNVPLRRYAQPNNIASVVEFYLSDKSNHITGTNLTCDGGFTRGY